MINIIAAVGKNLEIGLNNKLIWHIPNDLKYFKEMTINNTVVMGRKTYDSMGKALPNRKNIVLTRSNMILDDAEVLHHYKEILNKEENIFIIGGESVYKMFLPYADNLYLTEINAIHEADTYFPNFNKDLYKKEVIKKEKYNDLEYSFVVYKRKG